jgi:hypothetical protein
LTAQRGKRKLVDMDAKERRASLKAEANRLRGKILELDKELMTYKATLQSEQGSGSKGVDMGEAIATTVLAHRQLEMGRMWLGKSIQALDGGVSILDVPHGQGRQQQA